MEELDAIDTAAGKQKLAIFKTTWEKYVPLQDKFRDLFAHDKAQATELSYGDLKAVVDDGKAQLNEITKINNLAMTQAQEGANQHYQNARILLIAAVLISLVIAASTATWIALSISRGMARATGLARSVAVGDLSHEVTVRSNDEIKDMVVALNQMTVNLRATAAVADAIAGGDFTNDAKRRSDEDTLGIALERMTANLRATAKVANAIAEGDLTSEVKRLSDKDSLGLSLERMTANLRMTAAVADAIADGDLTTAAKRLAEKDLQGRSSERMTPNSRAAGGAVVEGDFSPDARRLSTKATPRNERIA